MTSSAVRTAARVASEIPGLPLRTRLTVASLTPACFATSASLRATLQLYDKSVQILRRADVGCRSGIADGALTSASGMTYSAVHNVSRHVIWTGARIPAWQRLTFSVTSRTASV